MTLAGFPDAAPLAGLAGGVLIGLAAAIMLLGAGRIAGVSGIAARAAGLGGSGMERSSAWAFVIGLPLGALVIMAMLGGIEASFASPLVLAIAGLI
ncbi:YeeE/YedE family protein, partial [Erythrobacter sp.]|nr:YeeE/YedE family protein [Erythrobacter sp.]